MKFKNEEAQQGFQRGVDNQKGDAYGLRIYSYATTWADLMEAELANGRAVVDVAEECSQKADTDGITGYMYGAAVSALTATWEHGEDLRRWHNKEFGRPEATGVINPAVITIG